MASLDRLPSGRWRVRWRDSAGAWRKSASVDSKIEAQGMRHRIEAELLAARPPRQGLRESLATLAAAWISAKLVAGRDPIHTGRERARLLHLLDRYGWRDAVELTPAQVLAARAAGPWSPRAGALLAACLRWAVERRGTHADPRTLVALRPDPPRLRPPRPLASPDEAARWHRAAATQGPAAAALVHCLARYGWRPISAARLRVADVDLPRRLVRLAVKGGDQVEHPVLDDTCALLAPLVADRKPEAPLFTDPRAGAGFALYGSRSIPQWWRDTIGGCGVYDLKRYAITHLLRQAPPHEVAKITGHRTPSVLYRYAQSTEERSREILAGAWAPDGHTRRDGGRLTTPRARRKPLKPRHRKTG